MAGFRQYLEGKAEVIAPDAAEVVTGARSDDPGLNDYWSRLVGATDYRRWGQDTAAVEPELQPGFELMLFDNSDFEGDAVKTDVLGTATLLEGKDGTIVPGVGNRGRIGIRLSGVITAGEAPDHTLALHYRGARAEIRLNGKAVAQSQGGTLVQPIELDPGREYDVEVDLVARNNRAPHAVFALAPIHFEEHPWIRAARQADAVVFMAGYDVYHESEAGDRTWEMPGDPSLMIKAIARANPRTITVIQSGAAVESQSWIEGVPAVFWGGYLGQQTGPALARVIFGEVSPSGKLPFTFGKQLEDYPAHPFYHTPAGKKVTRYGEGVFWGYRGFDEAGTEPQYAFGHGLSYTRFALSDLRMAGAPQSFDDKIAVTVDVANIGERAGKEVVQVYVEDMDSSLPRPPPGTESFRQT